MFCQLTNSSVYQETSNYLQLGDHAIRAGVKKLSDFSHQLEVVKFARMTASLAIDVFTLIAGMAFASALKPVRLVLNIVRLGFDFFKGFRRMDEILSGALDSWKMVAFNISGLVLFGITILEIFELCKVNLQWLQRNVARIPILGILPFGGVLDLAWLVYCGSSLLMDFDSKSKNKSKWDASESKLEIWNRPIDAGRVQELIAHHDSKIKVTEDVTKANALVEEVETFKKVQQEFDKYKAQLDELQQYKVDKWKKRTLERKYNHYSIAENCFGIGGIVVCTALTISGVGLIALGIVGAVTAAPGIYCGIKSFLINREISQLNPVFKTLVPA